MHDSVRDWVCEVVESHHLRAARVLDVGSLNVNGSCRDLVDGEYIGLDMRPGPGVDIVAPSWDMPFDDGSFLVVLCLEMVEHDERFWDTMPEIGRVLAPGGRLLLSTRGIGFPLHDYPSDYWRFTEEAVRWLMRMADVDNVKVHPDPEAPGWLAHGRKT